MTVQKCNGELYGNGKVGRSRQDKRKRASRAKTGWSKYKKQDKHKEREKFIFLGSFANLHIKIVTTIRISKQGLGKPTICLWSHCSNCALWGQTGRCILLYSTPVPVASPFLCCISIMLVNIQLSNVLSIFLKSIFHVMDCHLQFCYTTAPQRES